MGKITTSIDLIPSRDKCSSDVVYCKKFDHNVAALEISSNFCINENVVFIEYKIKDNGLIHQCDLD